MTDSDAVMTPGWQWLIPFVRAHYEWRTAYRFFGVRVNVSDRQIRDFTDNESTIVRSPILFN